MFKLNYKGFSYIYFYILILTIGILIYNLPKKNNTSYNINEYEYFLSDSYDFIYPPNKLSTIYNWKTNSVSNLIPNPNNYKYAILKLKLPKDTAFSDSLVIKTHNNNFDVYKKKQYRKTNTPIQNSDYITPAFSNTSVITEIEFEEYIYIYTETNLPAYVGYISQCKVIQEDFTSSAYNSYFFKFLIFIVCFIYSICFILYVFISTDYKNNKTIKKLTITMMLFTIFLLTDSSIIFSYFPLKEWTKLNTVILGLTTFYSFHTISTSVANKNTQKIISCISYSFIPFLAFIYYLDYAKIYFYNITYNYVLMYIVICLIALLIIFVCTKASKLVIIVNCIFISIFYIKYTINTRLSSYLFFDIYNLLILFFALFSFVLLKSYIKKNIEMQKVLDLVLKKRFEVNTITECINKTISSDYDIDTFCTNIKNSIETISNNPKNLELTIFKLDKNHDTFDILYDSTGMQFFRLEVEEHISMSLNTKNNIFFTSNKRTLYFSVEQNNVIIFITLACHPYINDKDVNHFNLYFQSIKKSLENILIYSSSMYNQEAVLEEVVKIINERENNKFNSIAVGNLSYYLALKLGLGYTKAMQCKIASYAINIGKLNIKQDILKADILSSEAFVEYSNYITISHNMVKHYDSNIMNLATVVTDEYYEKFDGSGKKGLKGEEININTRIIRLAINVAYYYLNENVNSHLKYASALQIIKIQNSVIFDPSIIKILENNEKEITKLLNNYLG